MKSVWFMIAGCVVSWLVVSVTLARDVAGEVLLGMAAPLVIAVATIVLVERTHRRDPVQVTQLMIKAFAAKMVLVGAYVIIVVGVLSVQATPFIVSFTAYFIVLYVFELLCLRRVLSPAASH